MHPAIGQHIKSNIPLTPQLISSINTLHLEQHKHGEDNSHSANKESTKSEFTEPPATISSKYNKKDTITGLDTKCPGSVIPPKNTENLCLSQTVPSASHHKNIMTVQPPSTIDFNDANGYFTTSGSNITSEGQPEQYMIYKLV